MTNEVSNIIFEAAISKAFGNRGLLSPSMEYFIMTGKVNGQFMLSLKRLMTWVENKTIEAAKTAMSAARQDEREKMAGVQLCPKCNGQGTVSKPPYVPGDVDSWSSTASVFPCNLCNGAMVIQPVQSDAADFMEWAAGAGWQTYDGPDRWICPQENKRVLLTAELYQLFKSKQ